MRKWLKYVKPYWHFFLLGPLCMIIEVIGEVIMPRLFSIVLERSVEANGITISLGIMVLMILCAALMMAGGIGGAVSESTSVSRLTNSGSVTAANFAGGVISLLM